MPHVALCPEGAFAYDSWLMDQTPVSSKSSPAGETAAPHREGIKETIESILIALILAFVFRAFVVEAFVIPSGSMAPTLLGAHLRFTCQRCGQEFQVNYPGPVDADGNVKMASRTGPGTVLPAHCPNCRFRVPARVLADELQSATNTPVHYGDRILVLKYLYLIQEPRRWDVVVFKSPWDIVRERNMNAPPNQVQIYGTNFIKRLVGLPGETLMILDGDIYVQHRGDGNPPRWHVQTKPRPVQEALWRIVYDNDHYPTSTDGWRMPWRQSAGEGWDVGRSSSPRILGFNNLDGAGELQFDRHHTDDPQPMAFTDWLAYNDTKETGLNDNYHDRDAYLNAPRQNLPRWNVSDLKLQFTYERSAGQGPLTASMTKLGHRFTAEFLPGLVRLHHELPDGRKLVVGEAPLDAGRQQVEFSNVDYRVTVRVNGKDLLQTTSHDASLHSHYAPDVEDLLQRHKQRNGIRGRNGLPLNVDAGFPPPTVSIAAQRQVCRLWHLSLWRDIYYTPAPAGALEGLPHGSPESPITLHRGRDAQGRENEYFVLGDNSVLSSDARAWPQPVSLPREHLFAEPGRVPERFLLGKAFFVYWPAGHRPLSPSMPGIIPNFGDMRFIH